MFFSDYEDYISVELPDQEELSNYSGCVYKGFVPMLRILPHMKSANDLNTKKENRSDVKQRIIEGHYTGGFLNGEIGP